jgi:hypothetical protein
MPEEPVMTGALPTPTEDVNHRNTRQNQPEAAKPPPGPRREGSRSQNNRESSRGTAARPSVHVNGQPTPPSQNQRDRLSDRNRAQTRLASDLNSRQPIRPTNADHRGPTRGPAAATRNTVEPPRNPPNFSRPVPTQGQTLPNNEPPPRITSLRPPDDAPTGRRMTEQEADVLCKTLCNRIWNENMGKVYDKVVEADRRGNVDDRLYYQLLDFFYCFLPVFPPSPFPSRF